MTPAAIVQKMMDHDTFSQWLGIEILDVKKGYAKIAMVVRKDMVNGFGIAHGGISLSFADSAFAFATNSHGRHAVSTEVSISHLTAINIGDRLIAETKQIKNGKTLAVYSVAVTNQKEELVAHFKGNVFRMDAEWRD